MSPTTVFPASLISFSLSDSRHFAVLIAETIFFLFRSGISTSTDVIVLVELVSL